MNIIMATSITDRILLNLEFIIMSSFINSVVIKIHTVSALFYHKGGSFSIYNVIFVIILVEIQQNLYNLMYKKRKTTRYGMVSLRVM